MASFNPAKILRDRTEIQKLEEKAVLEFKSNIASHYHSKDAVFKKAERGRFVKELHAEGIKAKVFMDLAIEAGKSTAVFMDWEHKNITNRDAKTLAQVQAGSSFSKVLCIVRELYAHDIAEHIPRARAASIVIEEFLFRS